MRIIKIHRRLGRGRRLMGATVLLERPGVSKRFEPMQVQGLWEVGPVACDGREACIEIC